VNKKFKNKSEHLRRWFWYSACRQFRPVLLDV